MKTRVIAAAVLLPILLVIVLVLPKIFTAILFGAMAALAAYELLQGTSLLRNQPIMLGSAMVMAFLVSLWGCLGKEYAVALLGTLLYCIVLFALMMRSHIKIQFEQVAYCLAAGLLIPFLFTGVVRIHAVKSTGNFFVFVPFILAFLSDTGAYFAGRAFGKRKLAPVISPNKTVEGVIGGVVAAVLGMLLYTLILQAAFSFRVNYLYAILYGILGSLGAVFGDLSFSVIKRQVGIKDFGNLIPGHGGILDRFDSMMVVGPLAEALLLLLPIAVK